MSQDPFINGLFGRAENGYNMLTVGTVQFFVARKFSKKDTKLISRALRRPGEFVFNTAGNIQGKVDGETISFLNPVGNSRLFGGETLLRQRQRNDQMVYDDYNVISPDLQWILHLPKDQYDEARWHILYNPLHQEDFKELFQKYRTFRVPQRWGGTSEPHKDRTTGQIFPPLEQALSNYCNSLKVDGPPAMRETHSWLDPTCNLFLSQERCAQSSLFSENITDFSHRMRTTFPGSERNATNNMKAGTPTPNCLCFGSLVRFANDLGDKSFLSGFHDRNNADSCQNDIVTIICQQVFTAATNYVNNATFTNNCGTNNPLPDTDPPPPDPLPANPPLPTQDVVVNNVEIRDEGQEGLEELAEELGFVDAEQMQDFRDMVGSDSISSAPALQPGQNRTNRPQTLDSDDMPTLDPSDDTSTPTKPSKETRETTDQGDDGWIGLVVAVLIIMVGLGGYFMFKTQNSTKQTSTESK
jgi:hypothetical protein